MTGFMEITVERSARIRRACIGASTAAIAMVLATPIWAQTADTASTAAPASNGASAGPAKKSSGGDAVAPEIVVTGIRQSIQSAVEIPEARMPADGKS